MAQPVQSKDAPSLASSIPEGTASLDSILCTEELQLRPSRPPDHAKENAALVALASAIRALFKQAAIQKIGLDLNEVIVEVLHLLTGETARKRVAVETDLAQDLRP